MDTTEVRQPTASSPTDEELRAWDWRAELTLNERSMPWLARHTQRSESAVRKYASGENPTPIQWLRMAAAALRWGQR
jgi:hypothetical protein